MNRTPLTSKGFDQLKEELHLLKTQERPAVIQLIAEARAHGDLSENAEYDAAKEKQSMLEGRIQDLENKISTNKTWSKLSDLQIKSKGKTYFFDSYSIVKYFPKSLKANFLFGDINYVPEEVSFVKSRPINAENKNSTGKKVDPRSFCIQKTLQNIAHGEDPEHELMFAGHNAWKFKDDPFYSNGFVPSVKELVNRIASGD